jgi:hypothetical protein
LRIAERAKELKEAMTIKAEFPQHGVVYKTTGFAREMICILFVFRLNFYSGK